MKSLPALIKLTQQKIEEKQNEINVLTKMLEAIEARIKELHEQQDKGFELAEKTGVSSTLYTQAGSFSKRAKAELEEIEEGRQKIIRSREEKQEEIKTLFAERKRYEILLERREAAARKKRIKKQQDELDDIAQKKY